MYVACVCMCMCLLRVYMCVVYVCVFCVFCVGVFETSVCPILIYTCLKGVSINHCTQ